MLVSIITNTPDRYQVVLDNYVSIVEKTNQQLGLWSNPYGLMVGILTGLVAVIAIFMTGWIYYVTYKQKEIQEEYIKKFDQEMKKRSDKEEKLSFERNKVFDEQIKKQQENLKSAKGEFKEEIQKEIDKLKREKFSSPILVDSNYAQSFSGKGFLDLSKSTISKIFPSSGISFSTPDDSLFDKYHGYSENMVCPNCLKHCLNRICHDCKASF